MFYIASPMNSKHMDYYMQRGMRIAQKLEKAGFKVYFPQRDTKQSQNSKKIFEENISAIQKSKAVVLILSNSRGIYMEAGYAKAHSKPVIGLRVGETNEMGPITRHFMDYFVNDVDDLTKLLKSFSRQAIKTALPNKKK